MEAHSRRKPLRSGLFYNTQLAPPDCLHRAGRLKEHFNLQLEMIDFD